MAAPPHGLLVVAAAAGKIPDEVCYREFPVANLFGITSPK